VVVVARDAQALRQQALREWLAAVLAEQPGPLLELAPKVSQQQVRPGPGPAQALPAGQPKEPKAGRAQMAWQPLVPLRVLPRRELKALAQRASVEPADARARDGQPELAQEQQAGVGPPLPPLLSRRVPPRRRIRPARHPADAVSPSRRCRRGSNLNASSSQ